MGRRVTGASYRLLADMELYMLAREGVVTITLNELNELPIDVVQHLTGFASGRHEMEKQAQEQQNREMKMRKVSRFG